MIEQVKVPPLGIMPQRAWRRARVVDLENAIRRFEDAGTEVPQAWLEEMREHAVWFVNNNA